MATQETHTTESEKLYELGFHILPTVAEDKVMDVFSLVKDIIIKNKGAAVKSGDPKAMKLAYPIVKKSAGKNTPYNSSYFAWIKFSGKSEDIGTIKDEVEALEEILRYIIVKTVDNHEFSTSRLEEEMNAEDTEEESKANEEAPREEKKEEVAPKKEAKEEKVEEVKEESESVKEKIETDDDILDKVIDGIVEEK